MIELAQEFVPATDEVYRLQTRNEADCVWFRRAVRGDTRPVKHSMQGIYVFTASGRLLASRNSLSARSVERLLGQAFRRWNELSDEERKLPKDSTIKPGHRWEDSYPEDGLVLQRACRDLARRGTPKSRREDPFNLDAVWFSAGEAKLFLPAKLEVGAKRELPRKLVHRFAGMTLVDNVRGQTLPYARGEVEGSKFATEIVALDGNMVRIRITGQTRALANGEWLMGQNDWKPTGRWPRGMQTKVLGLASYDTKTQRFREFRMVALGERWGRTRYNSRSSSSRRTRVGFALRIAPKTYRVAPAFVDVYNAGWIRRPRR